MDWRQVFVLLVGLFGSSYMAANIIKGALSADPGEEQALLCMLIEQQVNNDQEYQALLDSNQQLSDLCRQYYVPKKSATGTDG